MTTDQILMYNFEHPWKEDCKINWKFFLLTNGNEAILNGQIDLNIAGGTKSILPFDWTIKFVFIIPSKLRSALSTKI